jgi:hypothetical protein
MVTSTSGTGDSSCATGGSPQATERTDINMTPITARIGAASIRGIPLCQLRQGVI